MTTQTITIEHQAGTKGPLCVPLDGATKDKRLKLKDLARLVWAIAGGQLASRTHPRAIIGTTRASGTVTLATASGTVGATINGVAITVAYATSDANTASLLATAINASANALVKDVVTATSALGVVTISSVVAGVVGNSITLAASGTGATASGARLTGGAGAVYAF